MDTTSTDKSTPTSKPISNTIEPAERERRIPDSPAQQANPDSQKEAPAKPDTRAAVQAPAAPVPETPAGVAAAAAALTDRLIPPDDLARRFSIGHHKDSTSYAARNDPNNPLVRDRGANVKAEVVTPEAVELTVRIAQEKHWESIHVKGSKDFRRQIWMEASKKGMEVTGYKPTEAELAQLEQRLNPKNKDKSTADNVISPDIEKNAKRFAETSPDLRTEAEKQAFIEQVKKLTQADLDQGKKPESHGRLAKQAEKTNKAPVNKTPANKSPENKPPTNDPEQTRKSRGRTRDTDISR